MPLQKTRRSLSLSGRGRPHFSPSALVLALSAALALPASAWANDWTGAATSDWFTMGNWANPAAVPGAADDVLINTAASTTIVNTAGAMANGVFVGQTGTGALLIISGGTLASASSQVGASTGASGIAVVGGAGSLWDITNSLVVGFMGTGIVTIQNGGVISNMAGLIGAMPGSTGTVTVDGASGASTWNNGGSLAVGGGGTGTLNIVNGGTVNSVGGAVGSGPAGTGTVTVDGSAWNNTGNLTVGQSGTGTLAISNGGAVSNVDGTIGGQANSTGAVTVDGSGSLWTSTGNLVVGNLGTGSLAITNGGAVSATAGATIVGTSSAGVPGTLSILSGGTLTSNFSAIASNGGSSGAVVVDGANSSWSSPGGLTVGDGGTGTLTISNGGTVSDGGGAIGNLAGAIGTVLVDGINSAWTRSGTLAIGNGGTGTLAIANGGAVAATGIVSVASLAGSTGTLNIGGAAGAPAAAPGTLTAPAGIQFGPGSGAINFNHTDTSGNYVFGTSVGGVGTINQNAGWTHMTADSSAFTGQVNVNGGRLAVNGSLASASAVNVNNGGILGGSGFVGTTFVNTGGTIAPGNSIGTLNVNGNVTFAAGSIYQVETHANGQSDKIMASGAATLSGGTVQVIGGTSNYNPATSYSILTAQGGVTGAFANVTSDLAFLDPSLSYGATDVSLTLTRNDVPFSGVGQTPGQTSTGTGVQSLGAGSAVVGALLGLSVPQARYALEQLSGEVHASARGVQIQDSHFARDASLERLRAMDSEVVANDGGADPEEGKQARLLPSVRDLAYWARAMGSWGHLDGDNGSATVNRDTAGFLMGADTRFGEEGRFGLTGGYSRSSFDVADRSSSGSSDNYHLGAYAGSRWGALALRTGISYSWHDVSTSRVVAFPGFIDSLKADYKASTTQAFAELGYRIKTQKAELEPFVNLAHVNVSSEGFTERGGPAALSSAGNSNGVTFSTLGLRASTKVAMSGGADVTARGSVAWRHAFGDTAPTAGMTFAAGTPLALSFDVTGAPVARNVATVEAGLDFKLTNAATLGISYAGQFGSGLKDHGARVNLNVAF